jgi:hypothetical protein
MLGHVAPHALMEQIEPHLPNSIARMASFEMAPFVQPLLAKMPIFQQVTFWQCTMTVVDWHIEQIDKPAV